MDPLFRMVPIVIHVLDWPACAELPGQPDLFAILTFNTIVHM